MNDEPKITIDDLLARPPIRYEERVGLLERAYFDKILFGHVVPFRSRRRFDPRRLTDRWRKPQSPPIEPPGGAIVYELGTALSSAKAGEAVTIALETPAMAAERILREAE